MQKKPPFINIVIIVALGLLTALGGILGNLASNTLPTIFRPYLSYVWPLLGIVTLVVIGLTAWQYFQQANSDDGGPTPRSVHRQQSLEKQNRQRMLAKVHAFWIKGVLEQSLHGAALIALGLHEQPDAIANPWHLVFQQSDQPEYPLPFGTRIAQVYDDAGGELLILGEPGSGKTTLLLELTSDLLDRAQKDDTLPMPVIFNLSSWAVKRQPITDWLVDELNTKYQVPRRLGQSWVDTDQVLPLLDGLDEVVSDYRSACVNAINAYRRDHGLVSIVVCSRSTEYFNQTSRVLLGSAVIVQPLTAQQIDDYLASAGGQLAAVRVALRKDTELRELATMPLMLSVLTLAYYGKSVEDILTAVPAEARRLEVFDVYVQRMLQRRRNETQYKPQKTIHWLSWLAQQMIKHNQSPFFIERMQRNWLSSGLSRWHSIITGLVVGLLFIALFIAAGKALNIYNVPDSNIYFWLITEVGLIFGSISGFICGLQTEIKPAERVVWSWRGASKGFYYGLVGVGLLNISYTILDAMGPEAYGYNSRDLSLIIPTFVLITVVLLLVYVVPVGLVGGLVGGLIGEQFRVMQPIARVKRKWSWKKAWGGFVFGVTGTVLLIEIPIVFGLPPNGLSGIATIEKLVQLSIALLLAFMLGITGNTLEKNTFIKPNEGIRVSALNSILYGAPAVLILWLIATAGTVLVGKLYNNTAIGFPGMLRDGLSLVLSPGLPFILLLGLFLGLIIWLLTGGLACIQHSVLRLLLCSTKSIPGRYPQFLDYAADCILLRKVGGGYIFIHRLLLEYFASLDTATKSSVVSEQS